MTTIRSHLGPYQPEPSPTSTTSSQTTTPTSPHFSQTQNPYRNQPNASTYSLTQPSIRSTTSLSIHHPRAPTPPLFKPPPDQHFTTYLKSWGPNEMITFLTLYKCSHYANAFRQNDIDGKVILDLDMNALKDIGVSKVGERVKLLSGIKDLRKRASGVPSRVELRLNGANTSPLDEGSPRLSPVFEPRTRITVPQNTAARKLHSTRPPPLDLQPHRQQAQPVSQSTTPKPRPPIIAQSSSNVIVTSSVPAPSRHLNLRAPPTREGRRSPSPIADVAAFAERALPPAPNHQSSAAEYAAQHRHEGRSTPTWADAEHGLPRGPRPTTRAEHRKAPSTTITPQKQSPIKAKFSGILGRPVNTPIGPVHPFARQERQSPPNDASSTSSSHKRQPTGGYVVGTGGMLTSESTSSDSRSREKTTSSTPSSTSTQGQSQLPLEDIRRQVVKFINKEDGTTRTVNVASCTSGVEVLERVLKKFGKWNTATSVSTDGESDEDGDRLEVDGWGVYADSDPDDDAKPLSESNLLGICLSHRDGSQIRERGLVLRRNRKPQFRKNMQVFFGEEPPMSPISPTYTGPRLGTDLLTPSKAATKKMNRASTVSVMSGLGVMSDVPPSPSVRSPTSGIINKGRKMYNFFGHRPPSELITNHLVEYFPGAKRRELEKTVRHSMLQMSTGPNVLLPPPERASIAPPSEPSPPRRVRPASRITSPPKLATLEESSDEMIPRVSLSSDGVTSRPRIDGDGQNPPLLPPFEPSLETLSDSLQAYSPAPTGSFPRTRPNSIALSRRGSAGSSRSRLSTLTAFRRNRDKSDTASLLTVDEITAEVEQRRASTIVFDESGEEEEDGEVMSVGNRGSVLYPSVPQSEGEDSEDGDDEEDEESDEEEEEEESEDDEQGKAFTSKGSGRIIKWIKGALIGAGSFGSVYLGMDSHSGLLMAVKQVELPTGNARNEERKRSMVDALEREIELLKELQHDNIVQYLDSSADGNHLNIFLEYVPGGSVAALLNNYGAFEEALVRNFVRQILTGLNYLHEREIIHRDIKGANILVDNKGGIKISDFGISKKVENNLMAGMKANRPSLQGSVFWMAPEIVKQTSYTSKADIWSVGCLVVEMLTGTHPWAELTQMQAIFRIGSSAKPVTPADISPEAADLLKQSFEIDHNARSTAVQLLEHPFIAPPKNGVAPIISAGQARAAMAAATASREKGMQSLSALAEAAR